MYYNSDMLIYPSIFNCSYKYFSINIILFNLWCRNFLVQYIQRHYLKHIKMNRMSILHLFSMLMQLNQCMI